MIYNLAFILDGICSYHVFKPNSEEFPFRIDIKDKTTGEAVIEVVRKEIENTNNQIHPEPLSKDVSANSKSKSSQTSVKSMVLDCNKRKEYNFLIQVYDCGTPSLPSNK